MSRWRRKIEEEEDREDLIDLEEERRPKRRRRYSLRPRRIRTHFDFLEEEEVQEDHFDDSGKTFEEIEGKIRAGKYKPRPEDPWNAHLLYQMLKDLGDI